MKLLELMRRLSLDYDEWQLSANKRITRVNFITWDFLHRVHEKSNKSAVLIVPVQVIIKSDYQEIELVYKEDDDDPNLFIQIQIVEDNKIKHEFSKTTEGLI